MDLVSWRVAMPNVVWMYAANWKESASTVAEGFADNVLPEGRSAVTRWTKEGRDIGRVWLAKGGRGPKKGDLLFFYATPKWVGGRAGVFARATIHHAVLGEAPTAPFAAELDFLVDRRVSEIWSREPVFSAAVANLHRRAHSGSKPGWGQKATLWSFDGRDAAELASLLGESGGFADRSSVDALASEAEQAGKFDADSVEDARRRTMRLLVERRGQPQFRAALMDAYDRRCAVTGCSVEQALEAAHIVGYQGTRTNHVTNGLLLRADIHTLFDAGLMTIDSKTLCVLVGSELAGTEYDRRFAGRRIRAPRTASLSPDRRALELHRKGCGL
jgi:hypothetical protein